MKFKIGDKVIITKNTHKDLIKDDGYTYDYFNEYVGKTTTITGYISRMRMAYIAGGRI